MLYVCVNRPLAFSIDYPIDSVIQRTIEAFRRHIGEDSDHDNKDEDDKSSSRGSEQQKDARAKGAAESAGEGITPIPTINPNMKSHFQLQVKTLRNAPAEMHPS